MNLNKPFSRCRRRVRPLSQAGYTMIEVLIALAVCSFCLPALMGLMSVGMMANQSTSSQTFANQIASSVVEDLRATSSQVQTTQIYGISIPANGVTSSKTIYFANDGSFSSTQLSTSIYTVAVTFVSNGAAPKTSTFATVVVSWPGLNKYQTFVALNRN